MGIIYSIDAGARIVRLEFVGDISPDQWAGTLRAILRTATYEPGFGFLVDRRNASPPTVEYVEFSIGLAMLNERRLAGARWAVVTSSPASLEMARMGKTLAQGAGLPTPIQVFDDVESAERWLRLSALRS
jgi:hypothetical protein